MQDGVSPNKEGVRVKVRVDQLCAIKYVSVLFSTLCHMVSEILITLDFGLKILLFFFFFFFFPGCYNYLVCT